MRPMAYKNIEDRRAYHREYMRERRQWFTEHHLCTECGRQDALTMMGHRICSDCYEKRNGHLFVLPVEPKQKRVYQKLAFPKSEYYARCYDNACRGAWLGRKAQGPRAIRLPSVNTERAKAAYQYCVEHSQEYLERWNAEYGVEEYEKRASNQEQRARQGTG